MGCTQSRPILGHIEEAIFFLGSIYSTIVSYVSHFLNRFYNLLLSPLFRADGNVPSRICDDRGVCYRPKDRLMQKRKTDERIKRAEYAARGLDPKLALRPKDSRNASSTALVKTNTTNGSGDTSDERPLWVMGNVAPKAAPAEKRRSYNTERPVRPSHDGDGVRGDVGPATTSAAALAAARRKRRESAPPSRQNYRYEVLAASSSSKPAAGAPRDHRKSHELAQKHRNLSHNTFSPATPLDDSFATAADRLKQNHRRSLQVESRPRPHAAAVTRPGRLSPTARHADDTDAAGLAPAPAPPRAAAVRGSLDQSQPPSPTAANGSAATASTIYPLGGASPRGSIADLASAAANSKKTKDRKAWRGEISKVAKTRVSPSPVNGVATGLVASGATMGRFGGSPLTGEVISAKNGAAADRSDQSGFHQPQRVQTFA